MFYYKVTKIGDGSVENPFRPNYNGAFVWSDSQCATCGTFIIGIPNETTELELITDLHSACISRILDADEVMKWFVGDD